MKSTGAVFLFFLAVKVSAASPDTFPTDAFLVGPVYSVDGLPVLDEARRLAVVDALRQADRDRRLESLVPSRLIGGERWFDVRGLEIKRGELTGPVNFSRLCADYARFSDLDLAGSNFGRTLLRHARFSKVVLQSAIFDDAHLLGADFSECNIAHAFLLRVSCSAGTLFRQCTMESARFDSSMNLSGVKFHGTVLTGAVFSQCQLSDASFIDSDLTAADFTSANLSGVEWRGSTLTDVTFTDAVLVRAKLQSARFKGRLRFIRTVFGATTFGDLDVANTDMTYVSWRDNGFHIGEELEADQTLIQNGREGVRSEVAGKYAQAESIYRALARRYREEGYLREYLAFRERSQEARRKLLSLPGSDVTLERLRLNLHRALSRYDTSPLQLLGVSALTVFGFGGIFALLLWRRPDWFGWYRLRPDGREFLLSADGDFLRMSAAEIRKNRSDGFSLSVGALELSLEALFRFVENLINVSALGRLFFRRIDQRPLPLAWMPRLLFGFEASCGVVFLYFASRVVVIMVGGD
ncbi:MAG: pentapeptide repeat-containing protein [Candidatus Didemnitutus sp.]|nr:pentapeptide repeat-containing protein [Candidatus Didemnitutus sp.]